MSDTFKFDVIPALKYNVTATAQQIHDQPFLYFQGADIAWMLISSALVLLMVPGAALFYSGATERRSTLSMIWLPVMTTTVIGLQWYLWGYSATFSSSSTRFWGGRDGIALHNVLLKPVGNPSGPQIPELLYALYQGMFACFTASLVSGAVVQKSRPGTFLVFIVIWSTCVYDLIARWTWSPEGWSNHWGTLDFAGGTAVHICSGASAAAYSVFHRLRIWRMRNRQGVAPIQVQRTGHHNVTNVVLGTAFLWIGWFGFNGGSALGSNMRAVSACMSTHIAACAGGVTACLLGMALVWFQANRDTSGPAQLPTRQYSIITFCNGAVAGLVAITPAAGYVPVSFSPLFGILGAFFCNIALDLSKYFWDSLDIFAVHAIGGLVGMILTGFLARDDIPQLDGFTTIPGGGLSGHWVQLGKEIADALAGLGWAFVVPFIILLVMEFSMHLMRSKTDPQEYIVADLDFIDEATV